MPIITQSRVDCAAVFRGNTTEIQLAKHLKTIEFVSDIQFVQLASDCEVFRRRGYINFAVNEEERQFPLAFSIQVNLKLM
jgi:uncharacterized membrane protein YoaT (DUF817 family)